MDRRSLMVTPNASHVVVTGVRDRRISAAILFETSLIEAFNNRKRCKGEGPTIKGVEEELPLVPCRCPAGMPLAPA